MAGVAVQLSLLPTRCTVCRARAPAGQTGAVTGPALPAVVRELAGGTAGSAVAGEEGGLAVTGETELAVPAVLTVRAAAQTLPPGGVEPVTRPLRRVSGGSVAGRTVGDSVVGEIQRGSLA